MNQKEKIAEILSNGEWHCVTEFIDTWMVDYRRRLCDLQEDGLKLESRRCKQHNHQSALKEWRLQPVGQLILI